MSKFKNVVAGISGTALAALSAVSVFAADTAGAGTSLSTVVTADSLSGMMEEITGLLPVLIPVVVGFLAFRKGWSFLKSQIKGA